MSTGGRGYEGSREGRKRAVRLRLRPVPAAWCASRHEPMYLQIFGGLRLDLNLTKRCGFGVAGDPNVASSFVQPERLHVSDQRSYSKSVFDG